MPSLRKARNVVILVILALLGWYAFGRLSEKAAVRRLEANVRKKGEPLNVKQLMATLPTIPDEENAAMGLIAVWAKDDSAYWRAFLAGERPAASPPRQYDPDLPLFGKKQARVSPGQQPSPEAQRALENYLQADADRIQALRDALRRPKARFPIRFEETLGALLPHLARIKNEAHTLRLVALRSAQAADTAATLEVIRDIVRLSDTLANEPLMISQLVRASCVQTALDTAEDLLSRQGLSAELLEELAKVFEPIQPRKMLRSGLIGERVLSLSIFDDPGALVTTTQDPEMPSPAKMQRGMGFLSLIGFTIGDRRLILETIEQGLSIADDTSPQAMVRAKKVDSSLDRKLGGFPPKIFARLCLAPVGNANGRFTALEARIRAARLSCAIERYRLQHPQVPERLPGDLTQSALDPFDGQPLRYRASTNGYIVYSIGPDLTDNRGTKRNVQLGDEIFSVNR
jgi:hypothetical protein